ncbi:MAG: GFA family protein [Pseudomonadota bacterium]
MSDSTTASTQLDGKCLCGAITVTATVKAPSVGACHCRMCRRWGGGPLMTLDSPSNVAFSDEANVGNFVSSDWAERGFCKQCGTHLYYRLRQNEQYYLPAGLFDLGDSVAFEHQVFIDEKPGFYHFGNETKTMTGPEIFAMFGAS